MDRGARDRIVIGRFGIGMPGVLLLALLLVGAGCHRDYREGPPPPPPAAVPEETAGDNTAAAPEWLHPAVAIDGVAKEKGSSPAGVPPPGNAAADNTAVDNVTVSAAPPETTPVDTTVADKTAVDAAATDATPPQDKQTGSPEASAPAGSTPTAANAKAAPSPSPSGVARSASSSPPPKPNPVAATPAAPVESPKSTEEASTPAWARSPEELVYRVDFIGITMGYARFRYQGKVSIDGKPAYHLNVRAWTSGILSYIYPINETIDYYLDVETIAPFRQEFTMRESGSDDVALYDQQTGKIVYRYRQSGKIRKQVTTVPSVYDPVSVAYYFRWKDLGAENRPRNVYAGRKLYQIASRILGNERIRTEHGEVDTIAVLPLIRRDGKPDDKGDLKIWFSNDEFRVPVRLYAKFHKIKDWTLVGELIPPARKTGG